MIRVIFASIAFVVASAAATTATLRAPAPFSLVLESGATGWAARCDSGCHWTRLSFRCERACGATIDESGVVTLNTPRLDTASFRFRVQRTGNEVRATARIGTVWQTLVWTCRLDPCRARIDAYGVSDIDRARMDREDRRRDQ